jgi:hypothetical protein
MMEASIDMAVKILVIVMEEAVEVGSLGVGPQCMDLGAVEWEGGGQRGPRPNRTVKQRKPGKSLDTQIEIDKHNSPMIVYLTVFPFIVKFCFRLWRMHP